MRKIILLVLLLSICFTKAEEYRNLTIKVEDVYGTPIDNARVSVNYMYPQSDDKTILDVFTKNGLATFTLEADREYIVTITKAGFLSHTEEVDLEEDTVVNVILEYSQNIPVLHIQRYTVSPPEVAPGDHFQVSVVIENKGTGDALNVKVTTTPTQVFSPVQPSSSAYFERLDTGKLTSAQLTFAVSGEALSGVYDLVFVVSYQDALGLAHTVQESVGIPILRKPLLTLLNVEYPQEIEKGTPFTFSAEVANIGRFAVNGVYIKVVSSMDWEYDSYYVGSLEAGDFDTFTSEVTPTTPGEHSFTIVVGYVDDFNREHSQEESFSISVTEKVQETSPPEEGEKGLWEKFIEYIKAFLGLD